MSTQLSVMHNKINGKLASLVQDVFKASDVKFNRLSIEFKTMGATFEIKIEKKMSNTHIPNKQNTG